MIEEVYRASKFPTTLRQERELRGWSQARAAQELGTTPNTISAGTQHLCSLALLSRKTLPLTRKKCARTGTAARQRRAYITPNLEQEEHNASSEHRDAASLLPIHSPLPTPLTTVGSSADVCVQGFVWREAGPKDYVCVTPNVRSQAASDNSQASVRRNPFGAYGPETCMQGYVWREAFSNDHVCVTPQTRDQASSDNS